MFVSTPRVDGGLAPLFAAVGQALEHSQQALNQADTLNGNHGDHIVQVFQVAAGAVQEQADLPLADAMDYAAARLEGLAHNGSAQTYARGLRQIAGQLRRYGVSLDDLVSYVRGVLEGEGTTGALASPSGDVLKALAGGLVAWGKAESGQEIPDQPLDIGALFEFGMLYLQARQRRGSRAQVLADAAASASPLSKLPHRYASGKLAIQALLEAMQRQGTA
jgi:hypothetical protein